MERQSGQGRPVDETRTADRERADPMTMTKGKAARTGPTTAGAADAATADAQPEAAPPEAAPHGTASRKKEPTHRAAHPPSPGHRARHSHVPADGTPEAAAIEKA